MTTVLRRWLSECRVIRSFARRAYLNILGVLIILCHIVNLTLSMYKGRADTYFLPSCLLGRIIVYIIVTKQFHKMPPRISSLKSMIVLSDDSRNGARSRQVKNNRVMEKSRRPVEKDSEVQLATPIKISNVAAGSVKMVHANPRVHRKNKKSIKHTHA
ncbi:hypothetical protein F4814DRAFT_403251 [Daldinia grandis]|nr:hypothetical protein F4814DRAFT_403251 [Daldinia grandis]